MSSGGSSCIDRLGNYSSSTTLINKRDTIDANGTVTRFCVYLAGRYEGDRCKLKIFRQNGSNIDYVAESSYQTFTGTGLNTFDIASINVTAGDYVGLFFESTSSVTAIDAGNEGVTPDCQYHSGDVTTNTPEADWTGTWRTISFGASLALTDVYVNSSTGNDSNAGDSCTSGHPVQTFGKAYSLVASGGTVHCCNSGADFSGETVTFTKGLSITVDGNGTVYLPKFQ